MSDHPSVKILRICDDLGVAKDFNEAIYMACSDIDDTKQRDAIQPVSDVLARQLREAVDALNAVREEL